jgi:hypothetical protein
MVSLGLHLGHIMEEISSEISWEGGGHGGAAGITGSGDVEAALLICVKHAKSTISDIARS